MILDKIKAIPFVDESSAVKVVSVDGRISLFNRQSSLGSGRHIVIE